MREGRLGVQFRALRALGLLVCPILFACSNPAVPIPSGPDEADAPGCDGGRLYGAPPPPYSIELEGQRYTVRNGKVWKPTTEGNGALVATLYDPAFASALFSVEGCEIFRFSDDKTQKFPVSKSFATGFEGAADLQGLINPDAGFTSFTLQSPLAQTVPDYVALRTCLMLRTCDFKDNRLELLAAAAHDGGTGLRATSLGPVGNMITAKTSIDRELVHFIRGDRVKIGAWFRVNEGQPYGLIDLESAIVESAPGPRILLEGTHLEVELKFGTKPRFKANTPRPFPLGAWVHVEVEYQLQPDDTGEVRLWQDGELLIDAKGQTLPLPNTILNSLEVGITANSASRTVLDVDDLVVSGAAGVQ